MVKTSHGVRSAVILMLLSVGLVPSSLAAAEKAASACYEVAVPIDVLREANSGREDAITLSEWKPPAVCSAILTRLNQRCGMGFAAHEPPFPSDADFTWTQWQTLKVQEHLDVVKKILNIEYPEAAEAQDALTRFSAQLADPTQAPRPQLAQAQIDLWNTGKPETVYAFSWSGHRHRPTGQALYAATDLNLEGAGRQVFPGRHLFLSITDLPFRYQDRTYLWTGSSVGQFVLVSRSAPRGSSGGAEGCEFQRAGQPKYRMESR